MFTLATLLSKSDLQQRFPPTRSLTALFIKLTSDTRNFFQVIVMLETVSQSASPLANIIRAAVSMIVIHCLSKRLCNLHLHPLRRFPGPKLAAIGSMCEIYYGVVKDGTYLWEMERMHREYGWTPRFPRSSEDL